MLTNICSHHSLWRNPDFFTLFGEITVLSHFWRNPSFIPLLEKSQFYPTFGEIPVLSHFWRNPSFIPLLEKSRFFHTFGEIPVFQKLAFFRLDDVIGEIHGFSKTQYFKFAVFVEIRVFYTPDIIKKG